MRSLDLSFQKMYFRLKYPWHTYEFYFLKMILRNSKQQRLTLMTDPKSLLSMLNALVYEIIGIVYSLTVHSIFSLNVRNVRERELPRVRNTLLSTNSLHAHLLLDSLTSRKVLQILPKNSNNQAVGWIIQNQDKDLTQSFIDKVNNNDLGFQSLKSTFVIF